ncbi:MAG: PEP-CTERM sorting domain-containing protein [Phycisphaerales bacterium JB043]
MRSIVIAVAALATTHASAAMHTFYQGRLHLEADGSYTLESAIDLNAYRLGFADLIRNYAQWEARADQIASGITASSNFSLFTTDPVGGFGGIGDDVTFNPLATGGTHDISTGGAYIDKQLNQQKSNFEIASVDVEENIFKEEFGQVQAEKHNFRSLADEVFAFEFLATQPWDLSWLTVDGSGFTQEVTLSFGAVPTPSTALVLGLGALGATRRRRQLAA